MAFSGYIEGMRRWLLGMVMASGWFAGCSLGLGCLSHFVCDYRLGGLLVAGGGSLGWRGRRLCWGEVIYEDS